MAEQLHFDLVSPEKRLFAGPVDMVTVPGAEGDFSVLAGHAPFMATIRPGAIAVHSGGSVKRTFIHGGFAEVTPQGLTILAEEAVDIAEVNPERLAADIQSARDAIADAGDEAARRLAEERLEKLQALKATMSV